ncbi:aldolase/citrate lyase family protein [Psychrobacillus sp. FJAT-51614]|uniref:Aldolase/citrate lyase family protein n=1 Tax=Psychrobacillus mangrovi TaxID=3117745 RepID=A0ABU8F531_9BACI
MKASLKKDPMIGTFMKIPNSDVVHILAQAGFDFIICDMEHAQITENDMRSIVDASRISNIPLIIRYPDPNPGTLNRFLEMGVTGIQRPRVSTIGQVREFYNMMYFPPKGKRSFGNANFNAKYGEVSIQQHIENENQRLISIAQFESKDIEGSIEDYMEFIDVAFIGPVDLTIDLGCPGDYNNSAFLEKLKEIEDAARKTDTLLGAFAGNMNECKHYLEKGYQYIALSGDITLLKNSAKSLIAEVKRS